jgi:hypothetical protein
MEISSGDKIIQAITSIRTLFEGIDYVLCDSESFTKDRESLLADTLIEASDACEAIMQQLEVFLDDQEEAVQEVPEDQEHEINLEDIQYELGIANEEAVALGHLAHDADSLLKT